MIHPLLGKLTTMHGAGNRFAFAPVRSLPLQDLKTIAEETCRAISPHLDNLVLWESTHQSTKICIVNADGSLAATCGNALRCLGLLLFTHRKWDGVTPLEITYWSDPRWKEELSEEELQICSQKKVATLFNLDPSAQNVAVGMGNERSVVLFDPLTIFKIIKTMELGYGTLHLDHHGYVRLSNPHWVLLSPDFKSWKDADFERFGRALQSEHRMVVAPELPVCNIGMLWPGTSACDWNLRVYERGAGLTACCGSGATAARAFLEAAGLIEKSAPAVRFHMSGGVVSVLWESSSENSQEMGQRILSGPAAFF